MNFLAVGLGGCIGAILRYLMEFVPLFNGDFPVKTLLVNVLGSFVLGLLYAVAREKQIPAELLLFLGTGVCGGFTTFSTFAVQSAGLFASNLSAALLYICLSAGLSISAVCFAGWLVH